MVEGLTGDGGVVGLSLTGGTLLCPEHVSSVVECLTGD